MKNLCERFYHTDRIIERKIFFYYSFSHFSYEKNYYLGALRSNKEEILSEIMAKKDRVVQI